MAITRPAVVGRMGSTTFYETTMTARELVNTVRPARETESWASATIEERMQRDVNKTRVLQTIVPYLAQHPDRFFGAFIVLAPQGSLEFETLGDVVRDLPAAYRSASAAIGFLTFGNGELIALDGQHRLVAFREVITAGQELGPFAHQVGDDDVSVLFLEFESTEKTRRIFNKVNRHAKPVGSSDNIITSQDDGYALVTRMLLDREREAPLSPRVDGPAQFDLVTWTKTSLDQKSERITTLTALYTTVTDILSQAGFRGFSEKENPVAPDQETLEKAYEVAASWWEEVLSMTAFKKALADPSSIPSVRFAPDHEHTLLLRPVGQVTLVKGLVRAVDRSRGQLSVADVVRRADRVSYSAAPTSMWRDTIVRADGRMVARKEAQELAARLLAYLIAPEFTDEEERRSLWQDWNEARGRDPFSDLDEVADERMPEELPEPVEDVG